VLPRLYADKGAWEFLALSLHEVHKDIDQCLTPVLNLQVALVGLDQSFSQPFLTEHTLLALYTIGDGKAKPSDRLKCGRVSSLLTRQRVKSETWHSQSVARERPLATSPPSEKPAHLCAHVRRRLTRTELRAVQKVVGQGQVIT
jgi:hypothetical protein